MKAERIADALQQALYDRHVQFVLRQHNDDASKVALVATTTNKLDGTLRRLTEKNFDYGHAPSQDVIMREGQLITLRFRGNIKNDDGQNEIKMIFNSNMKNKVNFEALVKDKFAQKAIDCYRGFVQIFTSAHAPDTIPDNVAHDDKQPVESASAETLVSELLVNLPKVLLSFSFFFLVPLTNDRTSISASLIRSLYSPHMYNFTVSARARGTETDC